MKALLALYFFLFSTLALAYDLRISKAMSDNSDMPFIERSGAVALNVQYKDIMFLRKEISTFIKKPLKFLQSWEKDGEAHVTTITPPEFSGQLSKFLTEKEINKIATDHKIQSSDVEILGIGSGKKKFGSETGETFFVIIKSSNLLRIRKAIHKAYVAAGGAPGSFKPENFYPHITIGYTHQDIHEGDGLLKDLEHSQDERFTLVIE